MFSLNSFISGSLKNTQKLRVTSFSHHNMRKLPSVTRQGGYDVNISLTGYCNVCVCVLTCEHGHGWPRGVS